jgi:TRAP-type mannitol/chloroaromatic compound transport system permease large subunit
MSGIAVGLGGFAVLLVMLGLRIHIGLAMALAGAGIYLVLIADPAALLFTLNNLTYARLSNYDLSVIPLFILMGQFATHGGLSKALFRAAGSLIGH